MKQTFQQIKKDVEAVALLHSEDTEIKHHYFITDPKTKHFNFRYQLLESYKSGRKSTNTMDRLFLAAVTHNIEEIIQDKVTKSLKYLESDDVIAIKSSYLESKGEKTVIVSSDKDMQIIADTINPLTLQYKDRDDYKLWELCLIGDKADSIPAAGGYAEAKTKKLKDNATAKEFESKVRSIYKEKGEDIELKIDLLKPLTYDQVTIKEGEVKEIKLKSNNKINII